MQICINLDCIEFVAPWLYRRGFKKYQCTYIGLKSGWAILVEEDYETVFSIMQTYNETSSVDDDQLRRKIRQLARALAIERSKNKRTVKNK